jgi:hypothetical protein
MTRSFRDAVIRTPDVSPELLYAGGQQKSLLLAGVWRSRKTAEPNMIIEVELDDSGAVVSVVPVQRGQLVRKRFLGFVAVVRAESRRVVKALLRRV